MPWEKAFPNESLYKSKMVQPMLFEPFTKFTDNENQKKSNIMTAVETYVLEFHMKFIKGEMFFDKWDSYVKELEKLDYKTILDMYNERQKKF